MSARRIYPRGYFKTIKSDVISMIKEGKRIRQIASKYDINPNTLAEMMVSAEVSAIRIRHEQDKAGL